MPRSLPRACQKAFPAATLLVLLSACLSPEMDIELTEDLLCERSEQCPNGLSCVAGVCVGLGQCGDGIVQSGEVCDDGDANSDAYALARHCNALCQGYVEEYCGDGIVQSEFETCDDGNETLNDRCPDGPQGTLDRCVRGGDIKDTPSALRAASRDKIAPSNRSTYLSFRLARTVRPETAPVIIIP